MTVIKVMKRTQEDIDSLPTSDPYILVTAAWVFGTLFNSNCFGHHSFKTQLSNVNGISMLTLTAANGVLL